MEPPRMSKIGLDMLSTLVRMQSLILDNTVLGEEDNTRELKRQLA